MEEGEDGLEEPDHAVTQATHGLHSSGGRDRRRRDSMGGSGPDDARQASRRALPRAHESPPPHRSSRKAQNDTGGNGMLQSIDIRGRCRATRMRPVIAERPGSLQRARSRMPLPGHRRQQLLELPMHAGHVALCARRARDQDHVEAVRPVDPLRRLPQQTLRAIALDGSAHPTGCDHRDASRSLRTGRPDMQGHQMPGPTPPCAKHGGDVPTRSEPVVRHGRHAGQAVSLARPRRRRFRTIRWPARVRMRTRKPCLRARRRLLGWNVRFTTGPLDRIGLETRQAHRARGRAPGDPRPRDRRRVGGSPVAHGWCRQRAAGSVPASDVRRQPGERHAASVPTTFDHLGKTLAGRRGTGVTSGVVHRARHTKHCVIGTLRRVAVPSRDRCCPSSSVDLPRSGTRRPWRPPHRPVHRCGKHCGHQHWQPAGCRTEPKVQRGS
jgi:hypothetical protein